MPSRCLGVAHLGSAKGAAFAELDLVCCNLDSTIGNA